MNPKLINQADAQMYHKKLWRNTQQRHWNVKWWREKFLHHGLTHSRRQIKILATVVDLVSGPANVGFMQKSMLPIVKMIIH